MVQPFAMARTTNLAVVQPTPPEISERLGASSFQIQYIDSEFSAKILTMSYRIRYTRQEAKRRLEATVELEQQSESMLPVGVPLRCTLETYNGIRHARLRNNHLKLYHPIPGGENRWPFNMPPYIAGLWLVGGNQEGTSITLKQRNPINILEDYLADNRVNFETTSLMDQFTINILDDDGLVQDLTALGLNTGIRLTGQLLSANYDSRMEIMAGIIDSTAYVRKERGRYGYTIRINEGFINIAVRLAHSLGIETRSPYRYYPNNPNGRVEYEMILVGQKINEIVPSNLPRLNHGNMVPLVAIDIDWEHKVFDINLVDRRENKTERIFS
ncbi:unnamed protein product [Cunninghamella blakesleeana]